MKIIWAIVKTGLLIPATSVCSFAVLALLFNDVMKMDSFEAILLLLLSAFVTGFSIVLIFVPIAVATKNKEWHSVERIKNSLPVVVIPVVVVIGATFYNKPSLFWEEKFLVIFLHGIIVYYIAFLIFFHSLSTKKS